MTTVLKIFFHFYETLKMMSGCHGDAPHITSGRLNLESRDLIGGISLGNTPIDILIVWGWWEVCEEGRGRGRGWVGGGM